MTPKDPGAASGRFSLDRFLRAHLSASDRLGETLCGLVTVLTFTLVAGEEVDDGRKGVLQLLAATAACCVTWGLIDGVLYVLDAVANRARRSRLARAVRDTDDAEAVRLLRAEVETLLAALGARDDDGHLIATLKTSIERGAIPGPHLERGDWLGGIAIFVTQLMCLLPAVFPFMVLDEPRIALRVSNACLVLLLSGVAFQWADEVGVGRLKAALVAGLLGAVLVAGSLLLSD